MSDLTHISETVDEEFNRLVALYHAEADEQLGPLDLALTWTAIAAICLTSWAIVILATWLIVDVLT